MICIESLFGESRSIAIPDISKICKCRAGLLGKPMTGKIYLQNGKVIKTLKSIQCILPILIYFIGY